MSTGTLVPAVIDGERLRQTEEALPAETAFREKPAEFRFSEQTNRRDFLQRGFIALRPLVPADVAPREHAGAHRNRQELKARKEEVRLDREVSVRCLHEVPLADPAHFGGHRLLVP